MPGTLLGMPRQTSGLVLEELSVPSCAQEATEPHCLPQNRLLLQKRVWHPVFKNEMTAPLPLCSAPRLKDLAGWKGGLLSSVVLNFFLLLDSTY